jgi:transposase
MSSAAVSTVSVDTLKPPKKRSRAGLLKTSVQKEEREKKQERGETRSRKIRMRLTKEQKKKMCNCMGAARFTYNKCVQAVRKEKFPLDQNLLRDRFVTANERNLPRPLTELQARREARLANNNIHIGEFLDAHPWLKTTPKCIRYNAVISLIKAQDSNSAKAEAKRDRGEKKHIFNLGFRSRKQPSAWTIEIDKVNIGKVTTIDRPITRHKNDSKHAYRHKWSEVSIFEKEFGGKMLLTEAIPNETISGGVKITRNRLGHFHMHVPIKTSWEELPKLKPEAERLVVALDPGVRAFQTFYSPDQDFGSYAAGARGFSRVYKEAEKCDRMVTELNTQMLSYRQRRDLTKSKYRSIERVRNLVNEVHKKVANDLCSNYDTILIPVFETQRMVRKPKNDGEKQRTISSKTARGLLGWKHFEFRNYLASKVIMAGKELMVVTEEYTTQCCGSCGALNKMGAAKVYECGECGFVCGRDENAARNIFL